VRTGALVDGFWLVDDGLKAGERVIVSGVQKLRPGTVVKVAAAPAAPAAAPAAAAPAAATAARQE
jgi:membrane fusion protein (multidrug efflux system)